jgi:hypothetical protein
VNTALKILGSIVGALAVLVVIVAVTRPVPTASSSSDRPMPGTTIAAPAPATISDGVYLVGTDIAAGTYTSPGPTKTAIPWCYWQRATDDSLDSIIANDGGDGPRRFTAAAGELVTIQGCVFTLAS